MPATRFALCNISTRYGTKLRQLGAQESEVSESLRKGSRQSFENYKLIAQRLQQELENVDKNDIPDYYMLQRIEANSSRISSILQRHNDDNNYTTDEISQKLKEMEGSLALEREEYMAIQKYWELGTEVVVMQTVIQLDGDVYTRVLEKYAQEEYAYIHNIHNLAVNTSYRYWKSIIQIIAEFLSSVFSHLMPKKP